jgi:hypothetical protein
MSVVEKKVRLVVENKAGLVVWRRRLDVAFIYSRIVELVFFG